MTAPIEDVPTFVAETLDGAGDDRLTVRRDADANARELLEAKAGQMTAADVQALLRLFNTDSQQGKLRHDRFSPAFLNAGRLISQLDGFNRWTERLWGGSREEGLVTAAELLADGKLLPSAGSSYPTMLMYLRDNSAWAVWMRATAAGLALLTDGQTPRNLAGIDDYRRFCLDAQEFMSNHGVPAELLDYVVSAAARQSRGGTTRPDQTGISVWLFQANPKIYDIDQALLESSTISWLARQHAERIRSGDRVYLWRSGPDGGVVARATVSSAPESRPADPDDPFVLDPEALAGTEARVRLDIEQVLPTVLRRSDLVEHPVLATLGVIRSSRMTNYHVTSEQDAALRALITPLDAPTISAEAAEDLCLPVDWLRETLGLLEEKRQVVFYGPPGTGKTFVALRVAAELTRNGGQHRLVQFHPSYSYEDFVGGFRPLEDDSPVGVRYRRLDGPLRSIAAAATADPHHPYVLVVDEINRGNIPKIFGELLFLLEYREQAIRLQYWPEQDFQLPSNLLLIGTMNTADRSIALVDAALRRRFYFRHFSPNEPPVCEVLRRWLAQRNHPDEPARLLDLLNRELGKDEFSVGPSYFMTDPDQIDRVWSNAIMPLLDEYHFGATWDRHRFELASMRLRLASPDRESDGAPSDPA